MSPRRSVEKVAAVDLGSNSFHLFLARVVDGQIHILDRIRQRVLLAAGLDEKGSLNEETQERALACLEQFGQHLQHVPPGSVRAVGTNTLRRARNARAFLTRAQKALGHPIEVISGREEARLIYLGVAHNISDDEGRRLVIDIGGGSTECIIGERFEPIEADSLYMGCVSFSLRYFPDGRIREEDFAKAEIQARLEFNTLERRYRSLAWQDCIGSSGTILTVEQVLRGSGWSGRGVTSKGLRRLRKALIDTGHADKLKLPGLPEDRQRIFAGGVAILLGAFDTFRLKAMQTSVGALREGVIYDLLGRISHEDVRDHTIRRMSERYHIDHAQAARIETTALGLLRQVATEWDLEDKSFRRFLIWASRLHEIGLSISFAGYQKHSAYIVAHADMPGFSQEDQRLLSAVILGHRRKLSTDYFQSLPDDTAREAMQLCVLLRLAVRLHRSRGPGPPPGLELKVKRNRLEMLFPEGWLQTRPLTSADFEEERQRLQEVGLELTFR